jgi:putative glutathione S-transferase
MPIHLLALLPTQAESGRYHLYVGNACPWCHRVLLAWVLRGLARPAAANGAPHITITRLADDPTRARRGGWVFDAANPDPVWGAQDLWYVCMCACAWPVWV